MISFRKDAGSRAMFFVSSPTASVFSCPLRQTRSEFFDKRSVLLYPSQDFHTQEIDDWRPKFRFRLWWPLIDLLLSVWRRCTKALRKQPMRGIESSGSKRTSQREPWAAPPFRLLSTGPCLHCVIVHCLASSQRSVTSPRKCATSFPSTETERAVQGSPHNACIH